MRNYKAYIWITIVWIISLLLFYYILPYFLIPFIWLAIVIFLITLSIRNIVKIFRNRKDFETLKIRLYKAIIALSLFVLTFYKVNQIPNSIIEKIDWNILFHKRKEIVAQVKSGELKPNVSWNNWVCELPFEFPIISNGGNDIGIRKNKTTEKYTIHFWVFRNFFDNPSTYFVYTENEEDQKHFEEKIKKNPKENWKLEENWYRIYGE